MDSDKNIPLAAGAMFVLFLTLTDGIISSPQMSQILEGTLCCLDKLNLF